jgi:hypothetical protein
MPMNQALAEQNSTLLPILVLLESRLVAGWLRTYRVHDEDYLCPVERLIQKCNNYDIIKENKWKL